MAPRTKVDFGINKDKSKKILVGISKKKEKRKKPYNFFLFFFFFFNLCWGAPTPYNRVGFK